MLFLGTLRQNLCVEFITQISTFTPFSGSDPLIVRTDAELITILQSACLLPKAIPDQTSEQKFDLNSNVDDEGKMNNV